MVVVVFSSVANNVASAGSTVCVIVSKELLITSSCIGEVLADTEGEVIDDPVIGPILFEEHLTGARDLK